MAALASPQVDPIESQLNWRIGMANLRQIALSLMVLTAFMLVLAAPFRWLV